MQGCVVKIIGASIRHRNTRCIAFYFHYKERKISPIVQAPAQVIAMKIFRQKMFIKYIAFFG